MPKLSELTDYEPPQNIAPQQERIYVSPNIPTSDDGDYFTKPVAPMPELPADNIVERIIKKLAETEFSPGTEVGNKIAGTGGKERYQLWPEKVIRSALTAIPDAYSGKIPMHDVDPETGELVPSQAMTERAMDMATFAGVGGLGGTGAGGTALGAGPSLRPALKYKDRLYKGKEGQQHMDVIPPQLYPEFQQMAMRGDDISHYNFGFVNDKGHFLSREDALKYGIDTGLIDPQAGKFGALTSTLMADSSKPGVAIEAMAKTAEPFYSAVEHTVNSIPQAKMNGEAWLGTLANKPGVKPEELDWTGLKSFLEENKGKSVTKEQVVEHLNNNKVELKEVQKGFTSSDKQRLNELDTKLKENGKLEGNEIKEYNDLTDRESFSSSGKDATKYHSYQLPGGENYREMLMTLPHKQEVWDQNLIYYMRKYPQVTKEIKTVKDVALAEKHNPAFRETMKGLSPEEVLATARASEQPEITPYKSSHWDEPNILAHVRMNDRTIEGKKSLHLEEIQSDWHQQGRRVGYKSGEDFRSQFKEAHEKFNELETQLVKAREEVAQHQKRVLNKLGANSYTEILGNPEAKAKFKELQNGDKAYQDAIAKVKQISDEQNAVNPAQLEAELAHKEDVKVPNAPFKTNWHELALKRMLREAAEKGYDRLSWTPGEAQAARYDLSKSVDNIAWKPEHGNRLVEINPKGGKQIGVYVNEEGKVIPNTGYDVHAKPYEGKSLSDIVGKETADKILKSDKGDLRGEGLKIGGEGMKGFYDQIIPKALSKISGEKVKYHAPKKVEASPEEINKLAETLYETYDRRGGEPLFKDLPAAKQQQYVATAKEKSYLADNPEHPVHYIDLPQSLKDRAMQKGFPLFSTAHPGYIFKPVDHDPFAEKKKK